jgi:hypothetical protein
MRSFTLAQNGTMLGAEAALRCLPLGRLCAVGRSSSCSGDGFVRASLKVLEMLAAGVSWNGRRSIMTSTWLGNAGVPIVKLTMLRMTTPTAIQGQNAPTCALMSR